MSIKLEIQELATGYTVVVTPNTPSGKPVLKRSHAFHTVDAVSSFVEEQLTKTKIPQPDCFLHKGKLIGEF